jgi:hypothetical protein
MARRQQVTLGLVSVKCTISPKIEGTNDGASKGEHSAETDGAPEYWRMGR